MAEKIILANDRLDSEVLFDVEVLEVDRTVDQTYGLTYPKQVAAAMVPPGFAGAIAGDVAQQFTLQQLSSLGKGNYLFKLPTNVQLDFFKQITDAKTLAAPKVRVVNNKKAEINIGDKQPILLSTTNVLPGQAATGAVPTTSTVTSIEFRDTGVKLTVEPAIHLGNELSLKMKIEVIRLGEQVTLQANPPITQFKFGNRSAETMLNVKDGETIVLGGTASGRRPSDPRDDPLARGSSVHREPDQLLQDSARDDGSHLDPDAAYRTGDDAAQLESAGVLVWD